MSDILKEAIAESKALKEAALRNAHNSLAEHFKESVESMVNAQLNEMDTGDEAEDEGEDTMDESLGYDSPDEHDTMSENYDEDEDLDMDMDEDDDLDLGGEEGDMDLEESVGFSEADLREALTSILDEVDHGDLGEMEEIDTGLNKHDTGLMDHDSSEKGWEEKDVPAKKDWTVKEAKLKRKIANLVVENKSLKKALSQLRETYKDVELFNRKLFYSNKLLNKPVVRENIELKKKIIKQLDSAKTIAQAKTVYESLETAVGLLSESARTKKKAPTLSEALGSHANNEKGISLREKHAHLINEDAKFGIHRMKKLAGLLTEDD